METEERQQYFLLAADLLNHIAEKGADPAEVIAEMKKQALEQAKKAFDGHAKEIKHLHSLKGRLSLV